MDQKTHVESRIVQNVTQTPKSVLSHQLSIESSSVETWQEYVANYHHWPAKLMLKITWCESRDEPSVINPQTIWVDGTPLHSTGEFQVLGGSTRPNVNVVEAIHVYEKQGLEAWAASEGCWGE